MMAVEHGTRAPPMVTVVADMHATETAAQAVP
jgi:hypothetical protein